MRPRCSRPLTLLYAPIAAMHDHSCILLLDAPTFRFPIHGSLGQDQNVDEQLATSLSNHPWCTSTPSTAGCMPCTVLPALYSTILPAQVVAVHMWCGVTGPCTTGG